MARNTLAGSGLEGMIMVHGFTTGKVGGFQVNLINPMPESYFLPPKQLGI